MRKLAQSVLLSTGRGSLRPRALSCMATAMMLVAGPLAAQSGPASLVRQDEFTLARLRASQSERAKLLEPSLAKLIPAKAAAGHSLKLRTTEVDKYGRTLARFDHYFHGVRVEGSEAIGVLRADGTTESTTYPFASFLEPSAEPMKATVTESQALTMAKTALKLAPGEPSESNVELVITPIIERQFWPAPTANPGGPAGADPTMSARVLRSWRLVQVVRHYLPKRSQAFTTSVDAVTGEVISHGENSSSEAGIQGVAQFNRLNGNATLPLPGLQVGNMYYLQRGGLFSVNVGDVLNSVYSSSSATFGDGNEYVSGQPSSLNGQTQAVDVFYGISSAYDFYLTLFGRHSIDGSDGYFIPTSAHHPNTIGAPAKFWWYRNAFGQESYWIDFVDRLNPGMPGGPTELSVTAHEWTHGVTRRCSRVGSDDRDTAEAKAINEASSTIMGTAVRLWDSTGRYGGIGYPDPYRWTFDWAYEPQVLGGFPGSPNPVGVEFLYRPSHPYVRWRSEPSWWTASKAGWTTDVHGMGAPLHRCFYFLANGAPALTADMSDQTDEARGRTSPFMPLGFDGLGTHNATVLFYQAMTQTFTTWMDLVNAGQAIQQAADQIFGAGSSNSRIVKSALAAVNLTAPPVFVFPSGQTHNTAESALPQPLNEHAGSSSETLPPGTGSLYYRVTVPAKVSITVATNAKLRSGVPETQGPSIQVLDATGNTVLTGADPYSMGLMKVSGPKSKVIDLMPGDGDGGGGGGGTTGNRVGATTTWRNDSSTPVTVLVRVFSSQARTWSYTNSFNTRLDIREITGDDTQATQW